MLRTEPSEAVNPVVLRIDESEEPDWKGIAKAAQAEAKELGKQLEAALKNLGGELAEKPHSLFFHPDHNC
jgi:hypothetical protein